MRSTTPLVLDLGEFEAGEVHHEMMRAHVLRHPAPAFHVEHDLARAVSRRHVEGQDGLLAHEALGLEPMAHLEAPDRQHGFGIIELAATAAGMIARQDQHVADRRNARIAVAGLDVAPVGIEGHFIVSVTAR
jgi:hypothetical protein